MTWENVDLSRLLRWTPFERGETYSEKLTEFGRVNLDAAVRFAQDLAKVKSPVEIADLSNRYAREQFDSLTRQFQELSALVQDAAPAKTDAEAEAAALGD